jgi:hypothetical protein
MKNHISICSAIVILYSSYALAGIWQTLNYPEAGGTWVEGAGNGFICGYNANDGFTYDGTTWRTYRWPGHNRPYYDLPVVNAAWGDTVVGRIQDSNINHGFLYDGTTWTTIDKQGATSTIFYGTNGSVYVGEYYVEGSGSHGFIYNGTTWTTLDKPGAYYTGVKGIYGNKIFGNADDSGFIYDGTTWQTLNKPDSNYTEICGISGKYIVGNYMQPANVWHGFLYDGSIWRTLDSPFTGTNWIIVGITDNTIAGHYNDPPLIRHGAIYTIHEPATAGSAMSYTLEITSGGAQTSGGLSGNGAGYLTLGGRFRLTIDSDQGLANLEDVNISFFSSGEPFYSHLNCGSLNGTFNGNAVYLSSPNHLNSSDNYLSGTFDGDTVSLHGGISDGMVDGYGYGCDFNAIVISQSASHVLFYKGTIKASKSIFDVNDTNDLLSKTLKGCWALEVSDDANTKGQILYSSALIYDTDQKDSHLKYYKIITDKVGCSPYDPCRAVMLTFNPSDADGQAMFYLVGEGRLIKYSNNPITPKGFVPLALKGNGVFDHFNMFERNFTVSGPAEISMTLDMATTRKANAERYDAADMIDDAVTQLTAKGRN